MARKKRQNMPSNGAAQIYRTNMNKSFTIILFVLSLSYSDEQASQTSFDSSPLLFASTMDAIDSESAAQGEIKYNKNKSSRIDPETLLDSNDLPKHEVTFNLLFYYNQKPYINRATLLFTDWKYYWPEITSIALRNYETSSIPYRVSINFLSIFPFIVFMNHNPDDWSKKLKLMGYITAPLAIVLFADILANPEFGYYNRKLDASISIGERTDFFLFYGKGPIYTESFFNLKKWINRYGISFEIRKPWIKGFSKDIKPVLGFNLHYDLIE
jgi:hypothetical protein